MRTCKIRRGARPAKTPFRLGCLTFQDPILLCCLLYLLLLRDYSGFLRLSLLASLGHEAGHILVYVLCCGALPQIRVSATGFSMHLPEGVLSPHQTVLLALAGPCTNFLLAGICQLALAYHFTLCVAAFLSANVLLGAFNMLPIPPLDGAVVFSFLREFPQENCILDENKVQ